MSSQSRICPECEGTGIFTLVSQRGMEGLYREVIDCPECQGSGIQLQQQHKLVKPQWQTIKHSATPSLSEAAK
ncbi:hypothetical protein ACFSJ3_12455 [Corallincola platygyrae]|uniref:Uncharacterized protein n=1 Tax=Corallincola platygyrae TaxID=1193278 RepID=A0ABW4XP22_9GAMM